MKRKPKKKKVTGVDFESMSISDFMAAFHVASKQTIYNWVEEGCPRNQDKSFSFYDIHEWILSREKSDGADLEKRKLKEQIRKLEIENEKAEDKYILRKDHEAVMISRASQLRNYFERTMQMNRPARAMRSIDELAAVEQAFVAEMMDAFIGYKI